MKRLLSFYSIMIVGFCVFVWISPATQAEELEFPTTEEEIIKALSVEPPVPEIRVKGRGGLKSTKNDSSLFEKPKEQGARGLGSIVDDEILEGAPKVAALILFDYNSAVIKTQSISLLQEYGKALQGDLEDIVVVVAGHTDDIGSDGYNLLLSERRAESVKNFLVAEYHVDEDRLIVKPYGESKPIDTNTTLEGQAQNRRVEFIRIE